MYSRVPNNRVVLNKRDLRKISDFFFACRHYSTVVKKVPNKAVNQGK